MGLYSKVSGRKVSPHVKVWEDFMGVEVPFDENGRRCHIHHLDENKKNNDILNLVCITAAEHIRFHASHRHLQSKLKMKSCKSGLKLLEQHKKRISEGMKKYREMNPKHKEGEVWTNKNGSSYIMKDGKIIYIKKQEVKYIWL